MCKSSSPCFTQVSVLDQLKIRTLLYRAIKSVSLASITLPLPLHRIWILLHFMFPHMRCKCRCFACVHLYVRGGKQSNPALLRYGLHAHWRGDDVEPWRKCPHLCQSSCVCPSRLAAQDHPFKRSSTPFFHRLSLLSHSHALKYRQRHQAGLFAITHPGDSRVPLLLMFLLPSDVKYSYV